MRFRVFLLGAVSAALCGYSKEPSDLGPSASWNFATVNRLLIVTLGSFLPQSGSSIFVGVFAAGVADGETSEDDDDDCVITAVYTAAPPQDRPSVIQYARPLGAPAGQAVPPSLPRIIKASSSPPESPGAPGDTASPQPIGSTESEDKPPDPESSTGSKDEGETTGPPPRKPRLITHEVPMRKITQTLRRYRDLESRWPSCTEEDYVKHVIQCRMEKENEPKPCAALVHYWGRIARNSYRRRGNQRRRQIAELQKRLERERSRLLDILRRPLPSSSSRSGRSPGRGTAESSSTAPGSGEGACEDSLVAGLPLRPDFEDLKLLRLLAVDHELTIIREDKDKFIERYIQRKRATNPNPDDETVEGWRSAAYISFASSGANFRTKHLQRQASIEKERQRLAALPLSGAAAAPDPGISSSSGHRIGCWFCGDSGSKGEKHFWKPTVAEMLNDPDEGTSSGTGPHSSSVDPARPGETPSERGGETPSERAGETPSERAGEKASKRAGEKASKRPPPPRSPIQTRARTGTLKERDWEESVGSKPLRRGEQPPADPGSAVAGMTGRRSRDSSPPASPPSEQSAAAALPCIFPGHGPPLPLKKRKWLAASSDAPSVPGGTEVALAPYSSSSSASSGSPSSGSLWSP
uniref:Uncharacterized protein n=1 Tax=Neospora caninum (strain Liverpool) TaxID=572307 RepID=A0A0F7UHB5_NEOCL|nr:TPA: hypothetical protein BN1204_050695 [Neospora caninum Liverpool]